MPTLPRIDEILNQLGKSRCRSLMDLATGYWQIPLDPATKEKTAFSTSQGHYEFDVMPMELTNAPASFQRDMDMVLSGLTWKCCLVYIDDIVIYSSSFTQHLMDLQKVFDRIRNAHMFIKLSKCHFCMEKLPVLGHIISNQGVETDPAKIAAVKNMAVPTNVHELR